MWSFVTGVSQYNVFKVYIEFDFIKWIFLERTKFGIEISLAWYFHVHTKKCNSEICTINQNAIYL